jgi:hypothetical protein
MRDYLGVGFGAELGALVLQLLAQLPKVLNDAIVHNREAVGGMRMRVALGGAAVRGPAGMPDADHAFERLARKPRFEVAQLALGAPARELAPLQRGHSRGVVAAIFEPLEGVDQQGCNRLTSQNAYNAAHSSNSSPKTLHEVSIPRQSRGL